MKQLKKYKLPTNPLRCVKCHHLERDHLTCVKAWETGEMESTCSWSKCNCQRPVKPSGPREGEPGQWRLF